MGDTSFNFGPNAPPDIDADGEVIICCGRVKCVKCGKVYGVCNEIEAAEKGRDNMLTRAASGTAPQASGGKRQRAGYTYIAEQDLSASDKRLFRIMDVKENTGPLREGQRRFSDIVFKGAFQGATRLLGMKNNNPNLAIIQEAFGLDENNYPGREMFLFLEEEEFSGRMYVRVEPVPVGQETGAKKEKAKK